MRALAVLPESSVYYVAIGGDQLLVDLHERTWTPIPFPVPATWALLNRDESDNLFPKLRGVIGVQIAKTTDLGAAVSKGRYAKARTTPKRLGDEVTIHAPGHPSHGKRAIVVESAPSGHFHGVKIAGKDGGYWHESELQLDEELAAVDLAAVGPDGKGPYGKPSAGDSKGGSSKEDRDYDRATAKTDRDFDRSYNTRGPVKAVQKAVGTALSKLDSASGPGVEHLKSELKNVQSRLPDTQDVAAPSFAQQVAGVVNRVKPSGLDEVGRAHKAFVDASAAKSAHTSKLGAMVQRNNSPAAYRAFHAKTDELEKARTDAFAAFNAAVSRNEGGGPTPSVPRSRRMREVDTSGPRSPMGQPIKRKRKLA